jgi:hypothetical protein
MSALLARDGREGLSDKWTLTPVGGAARIPTFVRLLTYQKGMLVADLNWLDIFDLRSGLAALKSEERQFTATLLCSITGGSNLNSDMP